MISNFNMIGLSRKKSVTCSVIGGSEEIFYPKVEMEQNTFDSLWNFFSNRNPEEKFIAVVEHDSLYADGTPKNAVLINIELAN